MKQYDKIIQAEGDDPEDIWIRVGKQSPPFIVLTIEEAQELFNAGMERFKWEEIGASWKRNNPPPDFPTYLTSKGINI